MSSQYKRLSKVLARSLKLSPAALENSFRLATAEEVSAVSTMRRQAFGPDIKAGDEAYLQWRYFRHAGYTSTLWVFEYQQAVIGAMGTEPVELLNCGKHESAIRSMDAIIDPEFSSRGLGAWMVLALQDRYDCILVCGGNADSRSMLKKMFHTLAARQTYKLMLVSNGYLKKTKLAPISGVLAPPINRLLAFYYHLKWRKISTAKDIEIRSIEHIDELIALLPDTPGLLGSVKVHRSGKYLAWRYRNNPMASFMVQGVFRQSQLLGYVIYSFCADGGVAKIPFGRLVDWDIFSTSACVDNLSSLFVAAIKQLEHLGAEKIVLTLNDKTSSDAALHAGFLLREASTELFVYKKDAKPDDPIFSPELWYQSISDSDAEGT